MPTLTELSSGRRTTGFFPEKESNMSPRSLRLPLVVALCCATPTIIAAQTSLPRAPGAHVVTISPPGRPASEPTIAVDPDHPGHLVGAFGGPVVAWSTDSGRTFTVADSTKPGDWPGGGDVSLTYDDRGQAFLCYLTFNRLGAASYWAHDAGSSGIFVRRSPDGGKTWDTDPVPVKVTRATNAPATQMEDMPRIWSDVQPKSPYRGNLYVAWIEWQTDKSIMLFSRSTDHGATWSTPIRISTHAGMPRDDNGSVVGVIGTVGPDGTMYVVWNDGLTIAFTTSRDGGRTFAPSRSIIDVGPPYFGGATGIPGVARAMGFPQIGVDPARGTLYVTWSDFRNGDVDVFLSRSTDRGATWSAARRVNDDPVHDGADQFFQWLAVDPVTGAVCVQFYDRRADPANRATRVTLARSTDGGRTFTNYDWSSAAFTGQNAFLGDYMWMTAYAGRVYGIWAEAEAPSDSGVTGTARRRGSPTIVRVGTADFTTQR